METSSVIKQDKQENERNEIRKFEPAGQFIKLLMKDTQLAHIFHFT